MFCTEERQRKVLFIASGIIFMGCYLLFGIQYCVDTNSYEVMSPIREPVYVLFIKFFTALFGAHAYAAIGLVQNLLAAAACFLLSDYIIRENRIRSKAVQLALFTAVIMPYVITPLFSVTKLMITNAIITEGITLSVYYLYVYLLLHEIWGCERESRIRYGVLSLAAALVLTLTRGQMLVSMIAWFIIQLAVLFRRGFRHSKLLFLRDAALCTVLLTGALGIRTVAVGAYNYIYNGAFAQTPYGQVTFLTNLIYVSDREAGSRIEDGALQELYYQIYDTAGEQGVLYEDAPSGFREEAAFFSDAHDILKMDIIEVTLGTCVEQVYGQVSYLEKLMKMDDMAREMIRSIAADCMPGWLWNYVKNIVVGLVRSVAVLHPLLYVPTFCGYAFLLVAGIYLGIRDAGGKVFGLFLLTALLTMGTVGAVSLMIMCISRYMIYNTSLIYMCGILSVWELAKKRKGNSEGTGTVTGKGDSYGISEFKI